MAFGQAGDHGNELQPERVPRELIPPAPPLTAEAELNTFKLQDGFKIQIVASDPMIQSPVALQFDPDGRLWVLEMRGFMPNEKGDGETAAVGRVSVLEDTNGDGIMDRSTVFIDHIVMPRAFMLVRGGLLLAEPPLLWFYRDTNGDGIADQKTLVSDNYAMEANPQLGNRANQEHSANSLTWAMDNWIYSANYATRFRIASGFWEKGATISRGQWGLSQDNYGRLFHNDNSDQLRADLVPAEYLGRNPNYRDAQGANVQIARSQVVWPGRVNPGVNRGYELNQLRTNGTLATYTAACGPVIYRGETFPPEFQGNAFLCEPAGNLIRRNLLTEKDGMVTARNAYDETEFLTSTDERFRPVNLYTGPDGSLYVVDMYRGLIQHRVYVTSYLLKQTLDRNLQAPVNLGRIFRIIPPSGKTGTKPDLASATSAELVKDLSHPNGWWRDTAQRLLVERADASVLPALRQTAAKSPSPLGQIHALWTLDGLERPDQKTLLTALGSSDAKVRLTSIRLCEALFNTPARQEILGALLHHADDPEIEVRRQLAFSLGEVQDPLAERGLAAILSHRAGNTVLRDAVFTSLGHRELEFAERLAGDSAWQTQNSETKEVFTFLARAVFAEGKADRLNRLLDLVARQTGGNAWRQLAMLDGMLNSSTSGNGGGRGGRRGGNAAARNTIKKLPSEPAALAVLRSEPDDQVQSRLTTLEGMLTWPGKPGAPPEEVIVPLTAEQEARFQSGKQIYATTCGACHQPDGNGREGLAPPLLNSDWALGPANRVMRIALQGVRGPINVNGKSYQLEMPALNILNDDQLASVLTYVRREWGHTAEPVSVEAVTAARRETASRTAAWTEAELLRVQ